MLDKEKTGKVSLDQIGFALRINNQCPSEADVQGIINAYMEDDEEPREGKSFRIRNSWGGGVLNAHMY